MKQLQPEKICTQHIYNTDHIELIPPVNYLYQKESFF